MSRRAARRPPRLDVVDTPRAPRHPRVPNLRARLVRNRVTGRHTRLGAAEIRSLARRLLAGDRAVLLGLSRFEGLTMEQISGGARDVWGMDGGWATSLIDPDRTLAGMRDALARVQDVARRGGRIAFATTRPASLLALHQDLVRVASSAGGKILDAGEAGPFRGAGRAQTRLWWLGGVAVQTDGDQLLADPGIEAARELVLAVPPPDLVVGDRGFAGVALEAGIEVVAFADLDALALGVATSRRLPVTVVPLQERRPATAYAPLADLVTGAESMPSEEPAQGPTPAT